MLSRKEKGNAIKTHIMLLEECPINGFEKVRHMVDNIKNMETDKNFHDMVEEAKLTEWGIQTS